MQDIVTVNAILPGSGSDSGVERCIHGLLTALSKHGRLAYRVWARSTANLEIKVSERFDVRRVRLPFQSRGLRILWEQIVLPVAIRKFRPALMHAPGYIAPLAVGAPIVLTVYDLVALKFPQWASASNVRHYRCLLPASIRRATAVVTLSQTVKSELIERFELPDDKIRVIPPAVDPLFLSEPPDALMAAVRRRCRLPSRFILYVGNIEPKKNPTGLLKAYAALCGLLTDCPPLVMAGRLAWKYNDFLKLRRELGLEQTVICLGAVGNDELAVIYKLAALLIMPSWYEGFGLPVLEAMACGTPVVASRGGALTETAGAAALMTEPDPDSLARGLAGVLNDPVLSAQMRERGREYARRFDLPAVAEQHEALYREIISRRPSS